VPSTTTHVHAVAGDGRSDTADEQSEVHVSALVSGLKKEIVQLQNTVHQLQAKVDFLLSFVGIVKTAVAAPSTTSITSASLATVPQSGFTADANVDISLTSTRHLPADHEKTGNQLNKMIFQFLVNHQLLTSLL